MQTTHYLKKYDLLPKLQQGQYYKVTEGIIKLCEDNEDKPLIIQVYTCGDILLPQSNITYYESLNDSIVVVSDLDQTTLYDQITDAREMLAILHQTTALERLKRFLYWFGVKCGKLNGNGCVNIPYMCQDDIADILKTTRLTINKAFKQLKKEGFVKKTIKHKMIQLSFNKST